VHARDDRIRHYGASGGGITGLLDHLMRKGAIDGAIVARTHPERPLVSQTFIARDRESLVGAQGSRYAPVSNCTALREILEQAGRYAIVGTPCMLQATTRAQELLAPLQERIVCKIGLVCAGMASRLSTKAFLQRYGVDPADVREIRYRGEGWPGFFRAYGKESVLLRRRLLGDELDYLVPGDHYLRCWNCLDHWGYFSDIVVSDPWTQEMVENERKGWTAIMVRTEAGKEFLSSAVEAGDLISQDISAQDMLDYNEHLVVRDGHPRHGWMAAYQLLFNRRWQHLGHVLGNVIRGERIGLRTTLLAKGKRDYYY
jgi:coenzyme F420 hydrogenase subunit beta